MRTVHALLVTAAFFAASCSSTSVPATQDADATPTVDSAPGVDASNADQASPDAIEDVTTAPDLDATVDTVKPQDVTAADTEADAQDPNDSAPPAPVDFDEDGSPEGEDCDDDNAELGSQELDTDCDGVLNEFDQIEGPDSNLYGVGFQDPVTTDWSVYLGPYSWGKHAQTVQDLDVAKYASSRRWLMRTYHSVDFVTEHNGATVNWRSGTNWIDLGDEEFQEHVNIMLMRLKAHDQAYIDDKKLDPAKWAIFQGGNQIYAIDVEASNWDNRFFSELASTNYILGFIEAMGVPSSTTSIDGFLLFELAGEGSEMSYAPTNKWKILAEAHIEHLEFCKTLLGDNAKVSYYGGPWDVRDIHLARGIVNDGLNPEELKLVAAAAMKRVKDVPLLTGTMQRFIDVIHVNGAQWYPPLQASWNMNLDLWTQAIFDAKVFGISKASEDASPGIPKGGMWFSVGGPSAVYDGSNYLPVKVTPKDVMFTGARWPDADPSLGNFSVNQEALHIVDEQDNVTQEGVAAFWPMPAGVLRYIASTLKSHSVYGFGFLSISALKPNHGTAEHRVAGYNNITWDDPAWNYEGALVALGQGTAEEVQESHEFMVDLFYDHIFSGIRLSGPN